MILFGFADWAEEARPTGTTRQKLPEKKEPLPMDPPGVEQLSEERGVGPVFIFRNSKQRENVELMSLCVGILTPFRQPFRHPRAKMLKPILEGTDRLIPETV